MSSELARAAYQALEPYHVLAYFNPHNKQAQDSLGLDELGLYFGGRGAPLGRCTVPVVAATFYNFNPAYVNHGWNAALTAGLPQVTAARDRALDQALRDALGEQVDSPDIPTIVGALRTGIAEASYAARPLAAAWAFSPWPDPPHLQLWHAISVSREFRGDGHLAALVLAGLSPVEAVVFHEAPHPEPVPHRRTLGRKTTQLTRGWSDENWEKATESLQRKGVLGADGGLSRAGVTLYNEIERETDHAAAPFWSKVPDAADMLKLARPLVKSVIDVGYLPGTRRPA